MLNGSRTAKCQFAVRDQWLRAAWSQQHGSMEWKTSYSTQQIHIQVSHAREPHSLPAPGSTFYLDHAGPMLPSFPHRFTSYAGGVDAGSGYARLYTLSYFEISVIGDLEASRFFLLIDNCRLSQSMSSLASAVSDRFARVADTLSSFVFMGRRPIQSLTLLLS